MGRFLDIIDNMANMKDALLKTMDEEGFFSTLFGRSDEALAENYRKLYLKKYSSHRLCFLRAWKELKESPAFSAAILKYMCLISDWNPSDKDFREVYVMIAFEDPKITRKSIELLKSDYPLQYSKESEDFDYMYENQNAMYHKLKDFNESQIKDYINGNG